jgi:hypothetical protein
MFLILVLLLSVCYTQAQLWYTVSNGTCANPGLATSGLFNGVCVGIFGLTQYHRPDGSLMNITSVDGSLCQTQGVFNYGNIVAPLTCGIPGIVDDCIESTNPTFMFNVFRSTCFGSTRAPVFSPTTIATRTPTISPICMPTVDTTQCVCSFLMTHCAGVAPMKWTGKGCKIGI